MLNNIYVALICCYLLGPIPSTGEKTFFFLLMLFKCLFINWFLYASCKINIVRPRALVCSCGVANEHSSTHMCNSVQGIGDGCFNHYYIPAQSHAYPDRNDKGGSLIHLVVYEKFINKLIYLSITISFVGVFYIRNKLFLCVCLCGCECFIQYRLFLRGCVSWLRQINETKTTKECRQRVIRCLFVVRFYHISNVFALVAAQGWARLDQY